jgi:hypothetical protein
MYQRKKSVAARTKGGERWKQHRFLGRNLKRPKRRGVRVVLLLGEISCTMRRVGLRCAVFRCVALTVVGLAVWLLEGGSMKHQSRSRGG